MNPHFRFSLQLSVLIEVTLLASSCAMKATPDAEKGSPKTAVGFAEKSEATPPTPAKLAAKPQILPAPPKLSMARKTEAKANPVEAKESTKEIAKEPQKPKASALAKGDRPTRYVVANVLNVRAKPSANSQVVGRLTRGSLLPVEIKGEWAKIGEAQYVQIKYLSATDPTAELAAK